MRRRGASASVLASSSSFGLQRFQPLPVALQRLEGLSQQPAQGLDVGVVGGGEGRDRRRRGRSRGF